MAFEFDYILVGGGLQSALVSLALIDRDPKVRILLIERDNRLAGNHTWSLHETDIAARARRWIVPLIAKRWPRYLVRFPGRDRVVEIGYASMTADRVHDALMERQGDSGLLVLLNHEADAVTGNLVRFDDGTERTARLVIDARGPASGVVGAGYQKFLGLEMDLERPPTGDVPVVMDATVPQIDGYRFLYLLPFTSTRWLVEDTYFSDAPDLDRVAIRNRIMAYLDEKGWKVASVVREETGVLPMPWLGSPVEVVAGRPLVAGYQGGWFHPATGYSAPVAIRLAQAIADSHPEPPFAAVARLARAHNRQVRFARLLNRLLFCGFPSEVRWNVFARFYRLPESVITRFYSLETTASDRARILCGRPPRGLSLTRLVRRSAERRHPSQNATRGA